MCMGKAKIAMKLGLFSLAFASISSLSACQSLASNPKEKNVMANVYGNRSQSVIGDVYAKSSDVTNSPSFSGRW